MRRITTLILIFILGGIIGFIFPIIFIYIDLSELGLDQSLHNIMWVISSQNMITFSFYALPLVFSIVFVLFYLNIEKNRKIREASAQMANMAHAAGMGEIAAEVIHNIGNVLTSVFASVEKAIIIITNSKCNTAQDAEKLLCEKKSVFAEVFCKDSKLEPLLDYYALYGKTTMEEYQCLGEELHKLKKKIEIVRDILMTQKSYAYSKAYSEKISANKIVDAAMKIFQEKLTQEKISIRIKYDEDKIIDTQPSKAINILSNLIKNSIEAFDNASTEKYIEIKTENLVDWIRISIRDSGPGISQEKKKLIFNYGYTTKNKGAGLGLHSCLNLANSLGGKFEAVDPKDGPGVVFNLYLPCK